MLARLDQLAEEIAGEVPIPGFSMIRSGAARMHSSSSKLFGRKNTKTNFGNLLS